MGMRVVLSDEAFRELRLAQLAQSQALEAQQFRERGFDPAQPTGMVKVWVIFTPDPRGGDDLEQGEFSYPERAEADEYAKALGGYVLGMQRPKLED